MCMHHVCARVALAHEFAVLEVSQAVSEAERVLVGAGELTQAPGPWADSSPKGDSVPVL